MPHEHLDVGNTLTPHMAAAQATIKALDKAYAKRHEKSGHDGACDRMVFALQKAYAEAFAHERDLGLDDDSAVSAGINGIIAVVTSIVIRQVIKMNDGNPRSVLEQVLQAVHDGVSMNLRNTSDETIAVTTFDPPDIGQS